MYGYNIHSGMPTMHGGLTGHGMHSLGGYLLGGAALNPANYATEDEYNMAIYNQKLNKKIYSGQKKLYARDQLKRLVDAEVWAAKTAKASGHPGYEELLTRDYRKDENILRKKTLPGWAASEYAYGRRFAPPRQPMTQELKDRMKYNAMVKKLQRERGNVDKIVNPKTGKMVYVDSPTGIKILKAAQTLGEFGREGLSGIRGRQSGLYSNVEEMEANRPSSRSGLSLGPAARSIAAAARSGRNPLGISDAELIAALQSGTI